jgi:hypothetical protein
MAKPDVVRSLVVFTTLFLFFLTLLGAYGSLMWGREGIWPDMKSLLDVAMPVESIIVGAAVVFYFAGDR